MEERTHEVLQEPVQACMLPRDRIVKRTLAADPEREYYVYVPNAQTLHAPVLVCVHGLSRNSHELARTFMPLCASHGVVMIAPNFNDQQYADYQRLGRTGRGRRADLFLQQCVKEASALTGADAARFHLFGFSGGAQFVHRFAMAYPHRVISAALATAGWYTFPDARRSYPYGIRSPRKLPGVRFNPEDFLTVPITVLVGARDVGSNHLRSTPHLITQQGGTRLARARNWVQAMRACALHYGLEPKTQYVEVAGVDHSFAKFCRRGALPERVFHSLFGSALVPFWGDSGAPMEAPCTAPVAAENADAGSLA